MFFSGIHDITHAETVIYLFMHIQAAGVYKEPETVSLNSFFFNLHVCLMATGAQTKTRLQFILHATSSQLLNKIYKSHHIH